MSLKELNLAFMLLGPFARINSAEILTLAGLGVDLERN